MEYDSKQERMGAGAARACKMKRSGFGTFWFMLAMFVHASSTLCALSTGFAAGSLHLIFNGILSAACVIAFGVMVAAPQENRMMRLIPTAVLLLSAIHSVLAARRMRDDLYEYLLAKGILKEILDDIKNQRLLSTDQTFSASLLVAFKTYCTLSWDMKRLISRYLTPILPWAVGTWFSHKSAISAWLTPFYLPKPPQASVINNYFPSPPPC